MVANTMAAELYIVSGETGRQVPYELKRAGTGLILFVLGCMGGLVWAAASRIGEAAFGALFSQRDILRMTGGRMAEYGPIFGQSALLTMAACGPSAVVIAVHGWSVHAPLLPITAAIAIGIAAWAITLRLLRHPLYHEANTVVRHLFCQTRDA